MITFEEANEAVDDTQLGAWRHANSTPGKPCAECGAPFDPDSTDQECRVLLVKLRDGVGLLYAVCNDCFDYYGESSYIERVEPARSIRVEEWPKITADVLHISDHLVVVF